jgi:hypothetical protein
MPCEHWKQCGDCVSADRHFKAQDALVRAAEVMPPRPHDPETWCDCAWCSVARALGGATVAPRLRAKGVQ